MFKIQNFNQEIATKQPVDQLNHDRMKRSVSLVENTLSDVKVEESFVKSGVAESELIVKVDGWHVSSKDQDQRLFEALIATVYAPKAVNLIDKNHRKITNKTSVASALEDQQQTIKGLIRHACLTTRYGARNRDYRAHGWSKSLLACRQLTKKSVQEINSHTRLVLYWKKI